MIEAGVQKYFTAANQNDNVNAENWFLFSASFFFVSLSMKRTKKGICICYPTEGREGLWIRVLYKGGVKKSPFSPLRIIQKI